MRIRPGRTSSQTQAVKLPHGGGRLRLRASWVPTVTSSRRFEPHSSGPWARHVADSQNLMTNLLLAARNNYTPQLTGDAPATSSRIVRDVVDTIENHLEWRHTVPSLAREQASASGPSSGPSVATWTPHRRPTCATYGCAASTMCSAPPPRTPLACNRSPTPGASPISAASPTTITSSPPRPARPDTHKPVPDPRRDRTPRPRPARRPQCHHHPLTHRSTSI